MWVVLILLERLLPGRVGDRCGRSVGAVGRGRSGGTIVVISRRVSVQDFVLYLIGQLLIVIVAPIFMNLCLSCGTL